MKNSKVFTGLFCGVIFLACALCVKYEVRAAGSDVEEWYSDYTYILSENEESVSSGRAIILSKYNGNDSEIVVPATAMIDGVEYTTIVGGSELTVEKEPIWYSKKDIIESITFEQGVKLKSNCYKMFYGLKYLQELDLSGLTFGTVTNMSNMFYNCESLEKINLNDIDTSNVTDMSYLFYNCNSLSTILWNNFNTSSVTNMKGMFAQCKKLKSVDLSSFDTRQVTDMSYMFGINPYAYVIVESGFENLDLSNFDTSSVTNMSHMFANCRNLHSLNLNGFDTSKVIDMSSMFECCGIETLDISMLDTSKVENIESMFESCLNLRQVNIHGMDLSNVTNMSRMFFSCEGMKSINLKNLLLDNVRDMSKMFGWCTELTDVDAGDLNVSKVRDMSSMFAGCTNLSNLVLDNWNTEKLTNMCGMFYRCESIEKLDVHHIKTDNVTNMEDLFCGCIKLKVLDLTTWNTDNVEKMTHMFASDHTILPDKYMSLEELDLSSFNTYNVKKMGSMFNGCANLVKLDISKFDLEVSVCGEKFLSTCSSLHELVIPAATNETNICLPKQFYILNNGVVDKTHTYSSIINETANPVCLVTDEHYYDENKVNPTCEFSGRKRCNCIICGYIYEENLSPLGHDYKKTVFKWSEDGKSCKITYTCENDPSHTVEYDAIVTSEVKTEATCTTKGTTTYTAKYGSDTDSKDVQDIAVDASNHVWEKDYTIDVLATRTTNGSKSIHCKSCEAKKNVTVIQATGSDEKVVKKNQKITTVKLKTYKAKSLKRKKVVFSLKAKTSGNGKLTYKVTKGKSKYITVSKTGKVTLKKGCKKGTYKIKITASATEKYKAATKVISIKVK